jgi:hypothetical protein
MTSGVYRPLTWVDLLQSINGQNSATADTSTAGLGYVAEADEETTWADAATGLVVTGSPGWDQEVWGASVYQ